MNPRLEASDARREGRTQRRALVCPDKFRGTLTAAAAAAGDGRRASEPPGSTTVREVPLADGGEGTLDALLDARGGARRTHAA